jgi:hypothetical protein
LEIAQQLVIAWDQALNAAIRCPECKSLLVDYPQVTRKFFFTNLAIGLFAELGLVEKDYYCEACHYMWPKPRVIHPPQDHAELDPNCRMESLSQTDFEASVGVYITELPERELLKEPPTLDRINAIIIAATRSKGSGWLVRSG